MANLKVKDSDDAVQEIKAAGDGSSGDPLILVRSIDQSTPGTTDSVTIKASAGIGSLTEAAPATDTASSGLNGRLQRIAQRLTSLIALLPAALGANGGLKVEGVASGTAVPVSGTITAVTAITNALPAGTNAIGKLAANSGVDIGDVDVTSISAGENHLGEVGGSSLTVTPTHTVDTAVYAAGDTVGGIITIANAFRASGKESILQSIHILDRSNQKPTGNLLFFNASPAAATTTDNAAFVYSTDDLKEVARVPVVSSDYATINSKAVANLSSLGRQVYATTGTSLFVVFVTDGAPDFVASTDFQVSYSFLRD